MSVCHLLSCLQPLQPFHWLGFCRRSKRSAKPHSKRSLRSSTKIRKTRCQCMRASSERNAVPRQLSPLAEESQRVIITRSESFPTELNKEEHTVQSPSIPIPKANRSDKSFLDSTSLSVVGGPPTLHLMPRLSSSDSSFEKESSVRSMDQVDSFCPNENDSIDLHVSEPTLFDCNQFNFCMDTANRMDVDPIDSPIVNSIVNSLADPRMSERESIKTNSCVENVEMRCMKETLAKASLDQSASAPSERVLSCTFKFSNISCTDRTQSTSSNLTSNVTSTSQSNAGCLTTTESKSSPPTAQSKSPRTTHCVAPSHSALAATSSTCCSSSSSSTAAAAAAAIASTVSSTSPARPASTSTAAFSITAATAAAASTAAAQQSINVNTNTINRHSPNVPDTFVSSVFTEMNNNINSVANQNLCFHANNVNINNNNNSVVSINSSSLDASAAPAAAATVAVDCSSSTALSQTNRFVNTSISASNEDLFAINTSIEPTSSSKKDEHEEELWIDIVKANRPLGLQLVAGRFNDRPVLLVHELIANGAAAADGRIRVGDIVRQVDEQPLHTSDVQFANTCLGRSLNQVRLLIQRIRLEMSDLSKETEVNHFTKSSLVFDNCLYQRVQVSLQKRAGRPLGISLLDRCTSGPGPYITEIQTNSIAQLEGSLRIGDHVLAVNGHDVSALSNSSLANSSSALMALKSAQGNVQIQIARLCPGFVINAPSSSPSVSSPPPPTSSANSNTMYTTSVPNVKLIHFKAITLNRVNNSFGFSVAPNLLTPLNQLISPDGSIQTKLVNLSYSSTENHFVKSNSFEIDDLQTISTSLSKIEPLTDHVDYHENRIYNYGDDHENDLYSEAVATIGRDWVKVKMQSKFVPLSPQCDTLHVINIHPNGACADQSQLKVGDRIIQINGLDVNRLKVIDVIRLLRTSHDRLQFIVIDSLA